MEFSLSPLLVDYFPNFDYSSTKSDVVKIKQMLDTVSSCSLKYIDSSVGTRSMRIYVYEGYVNHMEIMTEQNSLPYLVSLREYNLKADTITCLQNGR